MQICEEKCTFDLEISRHNAIDGANVGNSFKTVEGSCGDELVVDGILPGHFNDAYQDNCPDWDGTDAPDCCVSHGYGTGRNTIKNQYGNVIAFAECNHEANVILSQVEVNCNCGHKKGIFFITKALIPRSQKSYPTTIVLKLNISFHIL